MEDAISEIADQRKKNHFAIVDAVVKKTTWPALCLTKTKDHSLWVLRLLFLQNQTKLDS